MSFTSDYLNQEKKKKKYTGDPFTDEFLEIELEKQRKREEEEAKKLAAEKKARESAKKTQVSNNDDDIAPVNEKATWLQKGAFSDGYQFGDITKTILGTVNDVSENVMTAVVDATENLIDTAAYGVGAVGGVFSDKFQDNVGKFIAKDLLKAEETGETMNKYLNPGSAVTKLIIGDDTEGNSLLGDKADGLVQSGAHLAGSAALQLVGVPAWLTMGVNAFGGEIEQAYQNGATHLEAGISGAVSAGAEILFEKFSSGIKILKGTTLDEMAIPWLSKNISNKVIRTLVKLGIDVAGEGGEEVATEIASNIGRKLTYADEKEWKDILFSEDNWDAFVGGAIMGGVAGGSKAINSATKGRDYTTGLTATEERVVNKLHNDLIEEAAKQGKQLSAKEKTKLYDEIVSQMDKGEISIDTIEKVLGGEEYEVYRDNVESTEVLTKELDMLRNMKSGDMTDIQRDRLNELKGMNLSDTTARDNLKTKLNEKVYGLAKDTRLAESYNEKARRGQAFEADLTKYQGKQADVVKKAIDSGILNNTRRTHEFVDMVSKISADKGVLFDFANNAKLKESGFAIDGKTVNGFVTKDGVTLNIDAAKSLNTVVGHEITHVLEGTELYTEMQKALFEYAKSKNDYQGRYDSLSELYKGVKDADIDAELTADLVGDYLFTDQDFITSLSTNNRNVFKKIYDEVKYLWKTATAGSKEARELEKVKRAFDKAYKESGKNAKNTADNSGVKYSLNEFEDGRRFVSVETDQAQFDGLSTKEQTDLATKIIKEQFQGKVIGIDNKAFVNGKTVDEYTHPAKHLDTDIYEAKMRASTELDNLIDAGFNFRNEADGKYGHSHTDAVGGFDYFDAIFKVGSEYYQGLINIKNINRGKLLKDITQIKNITQDVTSRYGETPSYAFLRDASMDNIAQKEENVNTKFSISSDSDGKQLSKEQSEYFKDSKMRDDNGNLKVMYHGTQDAGFHIFDPSMSDDGTSLFFVDRNDVAASYSGTSETYEAQSIKSAEDMNKFIESIGVEGYEVVENNGKFTLLYEGERVADSNSAKGIYEEFCWYEGVGEGDANYKVYLNLTNPLVVDAKGRPWNKIDAEFSQEIYDKYNSLTPEEKAALTDLAEWEDFRIFNSEIQEAQGNAVASAYAKMGEDCNIYDLFSVAADNFSEESMRENARGYLKTRDYAQRAKEGGYDGVIFKNIHDNGGYSNGSEGASTVAIAFNSEQVKSVANESPTSDPDIRYSLSEYTAEEKKAHNDAVKKHFGRTYSWAETGYLLLDGTKLDLSGKHDGAPGGYRTVDHRDITEALGYDYGGGDYSGSLIQFMSEGNIRIIPEIDGINLSVKPTKAQEQALTDYISRVRGAVVLDIDDFNGYTVVSVEYPRGTRSATILNDIREWFDNGVKPETAGDYSLTKEGEAQKRYGNYNVSGKDIALDIAPVQNVNDTVQVDNSVDKTVTENIDEADEEEIPSMRELYGEDYSPVENAYTIEQELTGIQNEMKEIYDEYNRLKAEGKEAEAQPLFDKFLDLNERGRELSQRAQEYKTEEQSYLDSLTDENAPPEVDAPYNMPRGNITLDGKTVSNVTSKVNDMLGLDAEDSARMADIIQKYAQGEIAEGELFDEINKNFQYTEEVSNNEDTLKAAKKHIRGTRLFISPRLKADFNGQRKDGYGQFRKEHIGHFILVNDKTNALGVDQFYGELSEIYPDLFPADIDHPVQQLERIAEVCTEDPTIEYQSGAFDAETIQEVCDIINNGIREYSEGEVQRQLDIDREKFYESAGVDIAPVAATYDSADGKQIAGQQTLFEDEQTDATNEATSEEGEPPKIAEVLESTPKKPEKANLWHKIKTLVFDKQSSIEDISLKTKNRELMAKADFMLRSESRAQRHIKQKLMPILERVEATGQRRAYETYAYHLHNVDRMSLESKAQARLKELEGKFGPLMPEQIKAIAATKITEKTTERTANTIREAKEWLDLLEVHNKAVFGDEVTADVSRAEIQKFEAEHKDAREIADAMIEYNKELRQMLVDGGVISQETADLWGEMYPHYVPIKRAGKDGAAVKVPLDSRRTGINAPIARAEGGNSDMESLLDVMASRTEQVYRAIARNSFGLELMHTIDTVVDTQPTSIDEVLDSFENEELLKKGENGANPTFTVFEDGKRITFDITEELYDALKPTDGLLKADIPGLNFLTTLQRGLLTQYNPTFIATNAIKDIQDVLINSQHPGATYANVPAAIKELVKGDGKWIREYMDNGGEDLTYFDSKKQVFKKEDSKVKKVLGFLPGKIAKANDFVEKIPRLAEYIASRKAGASIEVAMLDAARVTTNFAAGGDLTKFANKNGFTFLNASVQGFNQQARNIREAKANGLKGTMQLAAKFALAGLPIMLFNALMWDDDEDYENLSDYIKDNYYIVAKYGDGKFVRIPKGRAVSVIQSAFEQMKNLVTGDDEVDIARFGELMVTNLAPNDLLTNNVLAPIMSVKNNETWYGEELVPTRLQDLPAAEQFDETTDAISKWLGEVTNTSPYKWNYLLDQYSGGVGDVALPMLTPESDGQGVLAPFSDKFTTDSIMKNQNVSDFYKKIDELTKNANSANATDEDILKSKYMNSVSSELGELYAQKREIQNSKLSDKEKSEQVREIQKQIVDLTTNGLSAYEDIQYEGNGEYAVIGDRYYQWYTPKEGDAYWRKLDDDQVIKYNLTKNAGDAHYVTDGNVHYRLDEDGEWTKISERQLERQNEVTKSLGITPEEYWSKTEISVMPMSNGEYEYAYDNPDRYAVAKAVGGYDAFKTYSNELYGIKADKDESGKSINGSRKEKVLDYINNLDADYGTKIILFKSEYNADDTYNHDIIEYLNSREDISYEEMETILKELGFDVDSEGNISWD